MHVSFDLWTSNNSIALLAMVSHFVDEHYNIRTAMLALRYDKSEEIIPIKILLRLFYEPSMTMIYTQNLVILSWMVTNPTSMLVSLILSPFPFARLLSLINSSLLKLYNSPTKQTP